MDKRILEIYINKYIKGKLDFDGIYLIPEIQDNKIYWNVENPNDLSYTRFAIKLKIEDSVESFLELIGDAFLKKTGNRRGEISKNFINFYKGLDSFYLSKNFITKLEKEIRKKKNKQYHYERDKGWSFTCQGFDYDIYVNYEEVTLEVKVILDNVKDVNTGEPVSTEQIEVVLNELNESGDIVDMSEVICREEFDLIYQEDRIYDKEESYLRVYCIFFDRRKDIYNY